MDRAPRVRRIVSRAGRHGDVAVLLGALNASRWASRPFGPDAVRVREVEDLARAALGLEFGARYEEGRGLGDVGAVALARRIIDGSPLPTAPRAT